VTTGDKAVNLRDVATSSELKGIKEVTDKINVSEIAKNAQVNLNKFVGKEEKLSTLADKISVTTGDKAVNLRDVATSNELKGIKEVTDKINVSEITEKQEKVDLNKFVGKEDKLSTLADKTTVEKSGTSSKIKLENIPISDKLKSLVENESKLSKLSENSNGLIDLVNKVKVDGIKGENIDLSQCCVGEDIYRSRRSEEYGVGKGTQEEEIQNIQVDLERIKSTAPYLFENYEKNYENFSSYGEWF
jgi:hypothetical protein